MSWVAIAIGGSALISGAVGSHASDKAAKAQGEASDAAIAEQRRQFDLTRQDLAPYLNTGRQALNALGSIYGYAPTSEAPVTPAEPTSNLPPPDALVRFNHMNIPISMFPQYQQLVGEQPVQEQPPAPPPSAPATTPDYSAFFESPDYNFRRTEGLRDINNSFAARGGALSGNALRALTEFNSNLAAGEFGNYFNRQAALAGVGQAATNTGAQVGANTASNIGNALIGAGNSRASGIVGGANAVNNAVQGGIGNFLLYRNLRGNGSMPSFNDLVFGKN